MPDEPIAGHAPSLDDLHARAARLWGTDRLPALEAALRRLSEALAGVAASPLAMEDEPFPTGPEVVRG
jgi:hypothetical protein